MYRFRLTEADRETYGGPEWVNFDLPRAVELEVDLLEQIEDATGYTIMIGLPAALDTGSLKAIRAAVWLARHIAGIHEPPFNQFKPRLLEADTEWVEPARDADPPVNRAERRARKSTPARRRTTSGSAS